jgi:hypothetical protein
MILQELLLDTARTRLNLIEGISSAILCSITQK